MRAFVIETPLELPERKNLQDSGPSSKTTPSCKWPIPRRDLSTKKTKPNIEKWPESPAVMLEFYYIDSGI